jgi:transposase-like protein
MADPEGEGLSLPGRRLPEGYDHEDIESAVAGELPGVGWQRGVVHFERNVLSSLKA